MMMDRLCTLFWITIALAVQGRVIGFGYPVLSEEFKLMKDDSAFDEIEEYNEEVGLEHNHPPGKHIIEGDMMEDDKGPPVRYGYKRGTIRNDLKLWRTRTIPYVISPERADVTIEIENGMREISSKTCLRFVKRTVEENYIKFVKNKGCWSYTGMQSGGQEISVGNGCEAKEVIVHEILHALGFYHEQSRADRDEFVEIFWKNIKPQRVKSFKKRDPSESADLNLPYDLKSVMHYGNHAFGIKKAQTIMSKKYPKLKLGNDEGLSPGDVDELKRLYRCESLPIGGYGEWNEWLPCGANVRLKYRICYGQTLSVCRGHGLQNGVQAVRETCTAEPLQAFMEGCFNHRMDIFNQLPLQRKPTALACTGLNEENKNVFDWDNKMSEAFLICSHFAQMNGFKKFGIGNYCQCHYGNDDIDLTQNGKSRYCTDGYGFKDAIYLYIIGNASKA